MNGSIHTAAAQQGRVGGVDDGIDPLLSDVTQYEANNAHEAILTVTTGQ